MTRSKDRRVSGRDHFAQIYESDLELEAKWQSYGAIEKVDSIERLLRSTGTHPSTLVELGCGTGAVILECQRRGLADELIAVDYSEVAINHLRQRAPGIRCIVDDITGSAFSVKRGDVVVLSHVLEHLEEPVEFLRALLQNMDFDYLIAEVPLEDLWAARIKNLARDRTRNAAGHVQFFTPSSFLALLRAAGLTVVESRRYVPILTPESVAFVARKDGMSRTRELLKLATGHYLPRALRPLWERLYYAHYTVLCRPPSRKARAHSSRLINIHS
jgi:SAM-dependent methyltransferase